MIYHYLLNFKKMNDNDRIEDLHSTFRQREAELREKYITPYLNSEDENYRMDLEAYTALFYGAIEDFTKKMGIISIEIAKEKWNQNREINDTVLSVTYFCMYTLSDKQKTSYVSQNKLIALSKVKNEQGQIISYKDAITKLIDYSCTEYRKQVFKYYGGIDYDGLAMILKPAGIDLIDNPDIESAFSDIKKYRGSIVHRMNAQEGITTLPSIRDVIDKVDYCLQFCENVKDQVIDKI